MAQRRHGGVNFLALSWSASPGGASGSRDGDVMNRALDTADSDVMSDVDRGRELKRRRLEHGIDSLREFAEQTGVSRNAITSAEAGTASESTYDRLEVWLDRFDARTGGPADEPTQLRPETVTFRLSGNFGAEVTVEGPVSNLAELEESVARLLDKLGRGKISDEG